MTYEEDEISLDLAAAKMELEAGKFFKPELDREYRITVDMVRFVKKAFDRGGEKKLKAKVQLKTVDGVATVMKFETFSCSICAVLVDAMEGRRLDTSAFIIKQCIGDGGKIKFEFREEKQEKLAPEELKWRAE